MTVDTNFTTMTVLVLQLFIIAAVDLRRLIIPDICNVCLALTGVISQAFDGRLVPLDTLIGVLLLGGCFAGVRALHSAVRGRTGLGLGDVKFAAAAACWIDPPSFPLFLAVSSLSALTYAGLTHVAARGAVLMDTKIPFGPFLAFGLFITALLNQSSNFIP